MANDKFTDLPIAITLDGTELIALVQPGTSLGTSKSATTQQVADLIEAPTLGASYVLLTAEPALAASRTLTASANVTLTDLGAGSTVTLGLGATITLTTGVTITGGAGGIGATLILGSAAGGANQGEINYNSTANAIQYVIRRDGANSDHEFRNGVNTMARIRRDGSNGQSSIRLSEAVAVSAGGMAMLLFGSTATFGIWSINGGSPNGTLTAGANSLCIRQDGSSATTRLYVNTDGGTTWATFTASA